MTGTDLMLYIRTQPMNGSPLGKLGFRRLEQDSQPPVGLRIILEFIPWSATYTGVQSARWIALNGDVWSQRIQPRAYGRLEIGADETPPIDPPQTREVSWRWRLRPDDIEMIEQDHAEVAKSPRTFKVIVEGVVQLGSDLLRVGGEGTLQMGISDWETSIAQLGYTVAPSITSLAGDAAIASSFWTETDKRLAGARKHLRHGEPYHALIACLGEFERVTPACYKAESWKALLSGEHPQRADSIADWLAAHCTVLNRVGHHKARTDRDAAGDLIQMPLATWEADLIVAASHVLLTYALRLRAASKST